MTWEISATDARRLMNGDGIVLWHEKKQQQPPTGLSSVLRVQMGVATEPLNRRWFSAQTKLGVSQQTHHTLEACTLDINPAQTAPGGLSALRARSKSYPWAMCHPDGLVFTGAPDEARILGVFEAKHTGAISDWVRPTDVVQTNYWQFVHQMLVTGLDKVYVSVFHGNDEWRLHEVLRDDSHIAQLLGIEMMFLRELDDETPPGFVVTSKPDKIPGVPTRRLTSSDVEHANWGADFIACAHDVKALTGADEALSDAKEKLRSFLPDDAERIEAFGVRVLRTKRAVTITLLKDKAA